MSLRLATSADIDGMHAVRTAVRENRLSDPARITAQDYRQMLQVHGRGWVYESGGEIVGFGIVDLDKRNIWALFVAPGFERQGIGSALLGKMIEFAFQCGTESLWLTTGAGTRAERFYSAAGWRRRGLDESGELRFELPFSQDPDSGMRRRRDA